MSLLRPKSPSLTKSPERNTLVSVTRRTSIRSELTILWLEVAMQHLGARHVTRAAHGGPALLGPVAVVQRERNLEKDVPDLVFMQRRVVSLCLPDQ